MWRILAFVLLVVPLSPAQAGNVTKELVIYNRVAVWLSDNIQRCDLRNKDVLADYLRQELAGAGFQRSDESVVRVRLAVSGTPFGLGQCVINTNVQFVTRLSAQNIITDKPRVRQALDRLGEFDVVLWTQGMFATRSLPQPSGGGESQGAYEGVKEQLSLIFQRFKQQRSQ